jgi:hypothetical protein
MPLASRIIASAILALGVAACAKPPPPPYDIPSAALLQPDGAIATYVNPAADFRRYDSVLIEPVAIYAGAAGYFGMTRLEDRAEIALHMQAEFARVLGEEFAVVETPAPSAVRLRLILVGLQDTKPTFATASRLSIGGMAVNLWRAVTGGSGVFVGSVLYIAELYDPAGETLLAAFQSRRGADALDITEDFTALGSAKLGVTRAAHHMRGVLASMQNGGLQF